MNVRNSFVMLSSLLMWNVANALPQNGQVSAGSATISQSTTQTTINQTSQNAVINWSGFDTASNESVVFNQPNSNANVLNRINSGLPTNFAGTLTANGNVYILNTSGIVFSAGSKVDVAGLGATTLDVKDDDFMNGHANFYMVAGHENAKIINNGTITATNNSGVSYVNLFGPNVSNGPNGTIQANLGIVALSSGSAFVLDLGNDGLINFEISAPAKNGHLENAGLIKSTGGLVVMSMDSVSTTMDNMISMSGVIEASSSSRGNNGEIVLVGSDGAGINVSGTMNADSDVILAAVSGSQNQIIPGTPGLGINISGTINTGAIYIGTSGAVTEAVSGKLIATTLDAIALNGMMLNFNNNLGNVDSTGGGVVQIQNNQLHFNVPGDN